MDQYPTQSQHWRHYRSGKWAAVNPGWLYYKKMLEQRKSMKKPLNAYCVVGKHKLILTKYNVVKKSGMKFAVGTCPKHKIAIWRVLGK